MLRSKRNDKSTQNNRIILKDIQNREYSKDILDLTFYEGDEEVSLRDLLSQVYEINQGYWELCETVKDLQDEISSMKKDIKAVADKLKEYAESNNTINTAQSTVIDNLNDKVNIIVPRLQELEDKTKLL